jgi:predicted enzyme related to lactoylglutathione lyase
MKYKGVIWAGIWVESLETSISFYRDVLGIPLLRKGKDWAHFDIGQGVMLELMSGGKAGAAPKTADQQPIILGLQVNDLDSCVAELKQKGIHFVGEIGEFHGTRWAQFSDPEGNRLEIKEL